MVSIYHSQTGHQTCTKPYFEEIVLGTRCLGKYPAFNRENIDGALARAVVKTHEPR